MVDQPKDTAAWLAVDWGTSNLRAWVMSAEGNVIRSLSSDKGMNDLKPGDFAPVLQGLAGPEFGGDGPIPAVACGMVGARQGWTEAPYASAPCAPPTFETAIAAPAEGTRIAMRILSGVSQDAPPDVMRGEETQIAGFLAGNPDFDGVICLPGTHTKWVRISAGEIVSFQTFMTGELFALLSENSVLRHSVATKSLDVETFVENVDQGLSRPEKMAARLFSIRAGSLLKDTPSEQSRAALSGLLIGAEMAGARPYWLGQQVSIIGAPALADLYAVALAQQGLIAHTQSADGLTLAGLTAAYKKAIK